MKEAYAGKVGVWLRIVTLHAERVYRDFLLYNSDLELTKFVSCSTNLENDDFTCQKPNQTKYFVTPCFFTAS